MSGRRLSAGEGETASRDGEIFLTEGDVSNKEEGERYLKRADALITWARKRCRHIMDTGGLAREGAIVQINNR